MQTNFDPQLLMSQALRDPSNAPKSGKSDESLKLVSQEFEALFVQSLFKSMRATVMDGGLFEKNTRNEIFQDLMDMEISRQVSHHQSPGLAEAMYRQLATKE